MRDLIGPVSIKSMMAYRETYSCESMIARQSHLENRLQIGRENTLQPEHSLLYKRSRICPLIIRVRKHCAQRDDDEFLYLNI